MPTTKEAFPEVTAELLADEFGTGILLTQPNRNGEDNSVLLHPLQLRHFAERFAGMEPIGWMTTQMVKTLARRLHTLAFHIDSLYGYIKNHSDHKHADLSFELVKVTALTEMADEFCADLPDELNHQDDEPTQTPPQPAPAPATGKGGTKTKQGTLI